MGIKVSNINIIRDIKCDDYQECFYFCLDMNDPHFYKLLDDNTQNTLLFGRQISSVDSFYQVKSGWSGIEILEHICLTDEFVASFIFKTPDGVADKEFLVGESKLREMLIYSTHRVNAPDRVIPKNTISDQHQFAEKFSEIRANLVERLKTPSDLPTYRYYHTPLMGDLTVSDWLYFMIFHTERHLNQLRKLMTVNNRN